MKKNSYREKSPYSIIKQRYVTEKSNVLAQLEHSTSNVCTSRCKNPKVVFLVDVRANKKEITWAAEKIYADKKIKVASVNTILIKPRPKRVRGHLGKTAAFKKAVVTLKPGDSIEERV